ncbi:hypothetical protein MMC30_007576 [Trapelia coarctata]|nr:hypothetical protein [Trapelia coarctata]
MDSLPPDHLVIIITGASRGIGAREFAKQFARADPKALVLVARDAAKLAESEELIRQYNSKVELLSVPTDHLDEDVVKALFEKVKRQFGHADVLVNNAGVMSSYPGSGIANVDTGERVVEELCKAQRTPGMHAVELTIELQEVNVKGTFLVTKYFLQFLHEKPATVINLTSSAGLNIMPGGSAYAISKLAIVQLTAYIAAEYANVSAIALHPGLVRTDILSNALQHFNNDSPELAGGNAVWLASEEAKFMSGRYRNTNWDVEELAARRDEIVKEDLLRIILSGKFGAQQFE